MCSIAMVQWFQSNLGKQTRGYFATKFSLTFESALSVGSASAICVILISLVLIITFLRCFWIACKTSMKMYQSLEADRSNIVYQILEREQMLPPAPPLTPSSIAWKWQSLLYMHVCHHAMTLYSKRNFCIIVCFYV